MVGLNNELQAARGEAFSAEETVLWDLTSQLMTVVADVDRLFQLVVWLDVTAAKARYGTWLGGVLPTFVPWDRFFRARADGVDAERRRLPNTGPVDAGGSAAELQQPQPQQPAAGVPARAVHWTEMLGSAPAAAAGEDAGDDPDERFTVRLRGLRHPLLQGMYLKAKAELERRVAEGGRRPASSMFSNRKSPAGATSSGGGGGGGRARRSMGDDEDEEGGERDGGTGSSSDGESAEERLRALQPPRPIDVLIKPETSVVVITGTPHAVTTRHL